MKYVMTCLLSCVLCLVFAQNKRTVAGSADTFQTAIAVSDSGVQRLLYWVDEWEAQLEAEGGNATGRTSNLNLSKSNVDRKAPGVTWNARQAITAVDAALDKLRNAAPEQRRQALADLNVAKEHLEAPVEELYQSVLANDRKKAPKAEELKRRHEAVKNAINNIRV